MENALLSSFENRVEGFGRVDVGLATGKFLDAMVDSIMTGELFADRHIGLQLVGHDSSVWRDHLFDIGRQDSVAVTRNHAGLNRALATDGHVDTGFPGSLASRMFHPLLKSWFTAKVFFVQL
jgi:hypothetical protein